MGSEMCIRDRYIVDVMQIFLSLNQNCVGVKYVLGETMLGEEEPLYCYDVRLK